MHLISIIIPVYNAEKTLIRCLKSIQEQTYRTFEAILVNDGSTDDSKSICEKIARQDDRFKVVNISNGGVSNARNIGIKKCTGEFITFIDADDEVTPYYLSKLITESDFAVCGYKAIFPDGRTEIDQINNFENIPLKAKINTVLNHHIIRVVWGKLFRKSIIQKYNLEFDSGLKLAEDTLFVLQYCLYINSISISDELAYIYYRPAPKANRHNTTPEELLDVLMKFKRTEENLIHVGYQISTLKNKNLKTIYFYYFNLIFSGKYNRKERRYYFDKIRELTKAEELFFLSDKLKGIAMNLAKMNNFIFIDVFLRLYFYGLRLKYK